MHVMGSAGLVCMFLGLLSLLATVAMKWHSGLWMTGNPFLHLAGSWK